MASETGLFVLLHVPDSHPLQGWEKSIVITKEHAPAKKLLLLFLRRELPIHPQNPERLKNHIDFNQLLKDTHVDTKAKTQRTDTKPRLRIVERKIGKSQQNDPIKDQFQ